MLAIHIGRHAFPAGRGSARVVRLMMFTPALPEDPKKERVVRLFALVRAGFATRRKMLRRALAGRIDDEQFARAGIDPSARAETLALADWARLSDA